MVSAIHHHAWTDTSPVFYTFWAGSVTVVTSLKQEDGDLNLNWGLGNVRIIVEDFVVVDLIDNAVEGMVNAYPSPVLTKVANAPMVEEMEL